jgi:hypothetical protein
MGEWEDQKDKSVMWFGEYDGFVGCEIDVRCTIRINEKSYKSRHRACVEWPKMKFKPGATESAAGDLS